MQNGNRRALFAACPASVLHFALCILHFAFCTDLASSPIFTAHATRPERSLTLLGVIHWQALLAAHPGCTPWLLTKETAHEQIVCDLHGGGVGVLLLRRRVGRKGAVRQSRGQRRASRLRGASVCHPRPRAGRDPQTQGRRPAACRRSDRRTARGHLRAVRAAGTDPARQRHAAGADRVSGAQGRCRAAGGRTDRRRLEDRDRPRRARTPAPGGPRQSLAGRSQGGGHHRFRGHRPRDELSVGPWTGGVLSGQADDPGPVSQLRLREDRRRGRRKRQGRQGRRHHRRGQVCVRRSAAGTLGRD